MSKLEIDVKSMEGTSLFVGSEGLIHIRENGGTIRILEVAQARDFISCLETAVAHAEGKLMGDAV